MVLRDLSDTPESRLISQNFVIPPRTSSDQFTRIPLREQYILEDTIYIGIEQFTSDFIPIGLDKNTDNGNKIIINLGEVWERNFSVDGSLMIRPVFGTPFAPTETEEEINQAISIFPNPAKEQLNINGIFDSYTVMDLSGKKVDFRAIDQSSIDISNLDQGIYLIRFNVNGTHQVKKFIKQ